MTGVVVWAALGLAVLVVVGSATGAVLVRDRYLRLHLMSPVTMLGGPLIALAVVVADGISLATASVLVTVALLAVSGAALQNAAGGVLHRMRERP